MRRTAGDDKAFDYFEGALKASYLKKSLPESALSFAAKYAEGATGKSGRKIKVNGLQAKWTQIFNNNKAKTRLEEYHAAALDEPSQSRLTVALAARRKGTHEKFTAAVDKGTSMTNDEARVAFRYHFSLKLMEKLPDKCLCADIVLETEHTS